MVANLFAPTFVCVVSPVKLSSTNNFKCPKIILRIPFNLLVLQRLEKPLKLFVINSCFLGP